MTTTASSPLRRRSGLFAAAAVSVLALTGCQVNSPQILDLRYPPADGVEVDGNAFHVRDLLVVSHGNGAPAVVVGSVINNTDEEISVGVEVDGQALTPELTVAPNSAARLDGTAADGTEGERIILPTLESPAGLSVEVRLISDADTIAANAPVLLPQGHYAQFADDAGGEVEQYTQEPYDH